MLLPLIWHDMLDIIINATHGKLSLIYMVSIALLCFGISIYISLGLIKLINAMNYTFNRC